ncbi:hypothetical protein Lepto7375DRAFT_0670 [Leptolyngbya sp. PCC 7375]|nr:hypothetical protein Lepto7375DRAFT_0670 [Leptolyngbya sp. PCC 7375]
MSKIIIDELHPAGTKFFSESESYLNELQDNTLTSVHGGGKVSDAIEEIIDIMIPTPGQSFIYVIGVFTTVY